MSTSSIFNNIKVTNKKFCRSLINAMEESRDIKSKDVVMRKQVDIITDKEKFKKIFGE